MHKFPKGFSAFIATQSFGAFNDNFFKMLIQLYVLVIVITPNAERIIAWAAIVFTIPFVFFGPWAGYLADRFAKSKILQVVKFCETPIMLFGVYAFYIANINVMLVVLFLMATQSAFFAPAKAGFIPDTCSLPLISRANGIMGMTTFLAIIMGTALAGLLLTLFHNQVLTVTFFCVAIAIIGFGTSLGITKTSPKGAIEKIPYNPLSGIFRDIRFLSKQRHLFIASLAHSYFWLLGLMFQTNVVVYGTKHLALTQNDNTWISLLPALMGVGIAVGSWLAGRWSGEKIDLSIVPIGGVGLVLSGIFLFFSTNSYTLSCTILFFAGLCGGLYIIPLYSYLQYAANEHEKGRVLATNGIINGLFLVIASFFYRLLAVEMHMNPAQIFLGLSILTLVLLMILKTVEPAYFSKFRFFRQKSS